ncbi:MAG TPA: aspartate/glutamate racemase family protein [Stellaceae bacterium]
MNDDDKKFRFLLVQAFSLPETSAYQLRPFQGAKEERLMNYPEVAPLLADVGWDLHPGAPAPHGDWPVELREEFALVGASRLPIVREACESGRYNAIVLLGGGDPGFVEAREIARRYGIPVTACAHAQMHTAILLGDKFSVIDISEAHNLQMRDLVVRYRLADKCASIRNIDFPLPRPALPEARPLHREYERARAGERSDMLEAAVTEAVAAIEEDGAEAIILGCSAAYWLQPFLQDRLAGIGWEVPVLEGYRCAIAMAKLMVGLGLDASGLAFPSDRPRRWRRKKLV